MSICIHTSSHVTQWGRREGGASAPFFPYIHQKKPPRERTGGGGDAKPKLSRLFEQGGIVRKRKNICRFPSKFGRKYLGFFLTIIRQKEFKKNSRCRDDHDSAKKWCKRSSNNWPARSDNEFAPQVVQWGEGKKVCFFHWGSVARAGGIAKKRLK